MYKTITIKAGSGGWGGPLTISPTEKCNKILSVTGGGIHPVAQRIAEMTGGEAVDGFKETLPDDEVLVADVQIIRLEHHIRLFLNQPLQEIILLE